MNRKELQEMSESLIRTLNLMNEEEFEIWRKMRSFSRKYFRDMRFIYGKETHPDWDSVFMEYKVRLWKQPRRGNQPIACVSFKSKTIWLRKNREEDELKTALLHEILHIYCRYIPKNTAQLMAAIYYTRRIRYSEFIKAVLVLETIIDNPLLNDSDFQGYDPDGLKDKKKEKRTHSSLFIMKSLDLDEELDMPYGTVYGYGREDLFKAIWQKMDPNCRRGRLKEKLMNSPYLQGMIQNEIDQINHEIANLEDDEYIEAEWEC
jgi:hypothetical protein